MTIFELLKKFPTEGSIIEYFIKARYGETVICPHCGHVIEVKHRNDRPKLFNCRFCKNTFSIFKGTIFEKSDTDLRKWFYAIHLFLNDKKGISAKQLQREIGVTYKTAWRMLHKIREAMSNTDMSKAFEAIVEIDETYIGGKPRKRNSESVSSKRGRGTNKTPVVGVKERSSNKVYAQVALPNKKGQKLTGKQLFKILDKVCKDNTTVMTDDFSGYNFLDHENINKYVRLTVNHSSGQFYAGNGIHTNGIESFWSVLKRGIYGTYHHVSVKYLQNYVNEFCFRQNHRKYGNVFDQLVSQCVL
jgi:transposase-like protein